MAKVTKQLTEREAWQLLVVAKNEHLACYRIGSRVPERIFNDIKRAEQRLVDLEAFDTSGA